MKWFGALLLAGTVLTGAAQAGPGMGPYGPWNSGGAFGGFGPYATSAWNGGCRMPDRVVNTLAIQPEIVGERLVTVMPQSKAIHKKKNLCRHNVVVIGGERKVYQELRRPLFASRCTPTKLRLLGTQRFTPATVQLEAVAERSTFIPARREVISTIEPVREQIIESSACDLGNPYL